MFLSSHSDWPLDYTHFGIIYGRTITFLFLFLFYIIHLQVPREIVLNTSQGGYLAEFPCRKLGGCASSNLLILLVETVTQFYVDQYN